MLSWLWRKIRRRPAPCVASPRELSLPLDLLSENFELLAHDVQGRRALLQASLVCRSWRDESQRALHQHLLIPLWGAENKLRGWLIGGARGRYRLQSVDSLSWCLHPDVVGACYGVRSIKVEAWVHLALAGGWWLEDSGFADES